MKNAPDRKAAESALEQRHDNPSDLFPDTLPAATPAIWPTAGTRKSDALEALIAGPQNQCDYRPGWRLAAYVRSLKDDGWGIRSRLIAHPRCRPLIAEYTLDRQDPATAAALEKRKQGGFIAPELAGWLALLAVVATLAGWQ